jgi:hypothetical protein
VQHSTFDSIYAAYFICHWRHNYLNNPPDHQAGSFALCAAYFPDKTNQTQKVFDSKKGASRRNSHEWIPRPDVRPVKRYGRFAPLGVKKENTALIGNSLYLIYFEFDISVWMKRMNDPEGFAIKILMGRS